MINGGEQGQHTHRTHCLLLALLHSPSTWPANSGRGQGSCHQMQRGLSYQEQTLIPLLRWEVMHQSQSRPGKAWPCTVMGSWCVAGLRKGVSPGLAVPGGLKAGSDG